MTFVDPIPTRLVEVPPDAEAVWRAAQARAKWDENRAAIVARRPKPDADVLLDAGRSPRLDTFSRLVIGTLLAATVLFVAIGALWLVVACVAGLVVAAATAEPRS